MKNRKKTSFDNKEISLTFPEIDCAKQLFGEHNRNLKTIAGNLNVRIHSRANLAFVSGADIDVENAKNVLEQLYGLIMDTVFVTSNKRVVTPKSPIQKKYIDAIREFDMVFGIGPAGTGKTYLAMAIAVSAFSKGLVNRIILTRPAVEAGENLSSIEGIKFIFFSKSDVVRHKLVRSIISAYEKAYPNSSV